MPKGVYARKPRKSLRDYPIDKTGSCWLFQGNHSPCGYGQLSSYRLAHRQAWEEAFGPIPVGMHVCHKCDVKACVRPEHLFLGTNKDNMQDAVEKGRFRKGAENAANKLTDEQVLDIRRRWYLRNLFPVSARGLASEYGITPTWVYQIAKGPNGDKWQHLYEMQGLS